MKTSDEFSRLHPTVNIIFYISVLIISMFQMQIGLVVISLIGGSIYYIYLKKWESVKYLGLLVTIFLMSGVINPLFSHRGGTLLFYLPTGNPVTLESIVYGIVAALVLISVLLWFGTFNVIITFDKILGAIGKVLPKTSTFLSIVMRFVPRFLHQYKLTVNANKALGMKTDGFKNKIKTSLNNFSIVITWALENSVDTADAMRSRGYGVGKRTSYNNYKFQKRDLGVICIIIILFASAIIGASRKITYTYYYPYIDNKGNILVYITYTMLCLLPMIINGLEEIRWHKLKSKI